MSKFLLFCSCEKRVKTKEKNEIPKYMNTLDMQVAKMSSKSSLSKTRIVIKNRHACVFSHTRYMVWLNDSQFQFSNQTVRTVWGHLSSVRFSY